MSEACMFSSKSKHGFAMYFSVAMSRSCRVRYGFSGGAALFVSNKGAAAALVSATCAAAALVLATPAPFACLLVLGSGMTVTLSNTSSTTAKELEKSFRS